MNLINTKKFVTAACVLSSPGGATRRWQDADDTAVDDSHVLASPGGATRRWPEATDAIIGPAQGMRVPHPPGGAP